MNEMEKSAILLVLIDEMKKQGSWCGETHIQKAAYFLQDLLDVPLDFEFILYKYGPFSFDLKDHITSMRADGYIKVKPHPYYGPRLNTDDRGKKLINNHNKTTEKFLRKITFAASVVGNKDVSEVEALATAYFVSKDNEDKQIRERAAKLSNLKPHVSEERAKYAVEEVDQIIEAAKEQTLV